VALQCEHIFPFPFELEGDEEVKIFGLVCREREEAELAFVSGEMERHDDIDGE
jgi:hypothetical protein